MNKCESLTINIIDHQKEGLSDNLHGPNSIESYMSKDKFKGSKVKTYIDEKSLMIIILKKDGELY